MSSRTEIPHKKHFLSGMVLGCALIITIILARLSESTPPPQRSITSTNPAVTPAAGTCLPWVQVNTNAFGLPTEFDSTGSPVIPTSDTPYQSEEGFEVLVFDGLLYLGMEADNQLGARLWRTRRGVTFPRTQLDWEEVAADPAGQPFGISDTAQADHIDSLAAFNGQIYASLANRSGNPQGTLVFRSASGDAGSWQNAHPQIGPGFGKPQNENFKDMQVFDGHLCGGTWNEIDGAEVWCSADGEYWAQKNISGFGEPQNIVIWSGHVFRDQLYFGVQNQSDERHGRLYRTSSLSGTPTWEEVYRTPPGIPWGNILGDRDGHLYISVGSEEGMLIFRSPTGDTDSWESASLPGFANDPNQKAVLADGATLYNGELYAGVVTGNGNFSIWRTQGGDEQIQSLANAWESLPTAEIKPPYNLYVQLATFNQALYAWTSDPVNGQQVWRTICR